MQTKILSKELVPGDIVQLAVGDKIPADCRLLSVLTSSFNVDQSILTGETISVVKDPDAIIKDDRAVKQDQINMLFSGTSVTYGKGEGTFMLIYISSCCKNWNGDGYWRNSHVYNIPNSGKNTVESCAR